MGQVPEGFNTVSAHLVTHDGAAAIDFYKRAFGAEELGRMQWPNSDKIMHAAIRIGNSVVMLADEMREMGCNLAPTSLGGSPVTLHIYVEDVDALWEKAVNAGASIKMPLSDMFWGDRYGVLTDPFGHQWSLATKVKELSPAEMQKAAEGACAQMAERQKVGV